MEIRNASRGRWTREDRFFVGMALAILAAVMLGFARTFFLRPWFPDFPAPPETFFMFHGAAFTAWVLLLVVQPSLVAMGRTDLHRALGKVGVALAIVMVVLGLIGALIAARRATGFTGIPMPGVQFLIVPFGDMILFASFVGLAIARRDDPQTHKRLMILATLNLVTAAVARWPFDIMQGGPPVFFGLTDAFLVPLVVWDLVSRGRLHPVTLWGGLVIIVSQPLRLVLSGTAAWQGFGQWMVGLLGQG